MSGYLAERTPLQFDGGSAVGAAVVPVELAGCPVFAVTAFADQHPLALECVVVSVDRVRDLVSGLQATRFALQLSWGHPRLLQHVGREVHGLVARIARDLCSEQVEALRGGFQVGQ